ncbi:MAG: hypothetical protein MJE63_19810 [Proteobacteria bacterium]|nr:hypothetical protein [Pseudomonadota bacterium]
MFIQLKNNICIGVSELPMDEEHLAEDETQIELDESESIEELQQALGKAYVNGEFVEPTRTSEEEQVKESWDSIIFLRGTDWKVTRHRDQLDMGIETSLSDDEYKQLLQERQLARGKVIKPEAPTE